MTMQEPILSNRAIRQLKDLRPYDQKLVIDGIHKHLVEADPGKKTRNKFPLRRASEHADFELRLGDLRVFYRVEEDDAVYVALIGRRDGNRLLIDGEVFEL